jgi:hypothetical protein
VIIGASIVFVEAGVAIAGNNVATPERFQYFIFPSFLFIRAHSFYTCFIFPSSMPSVLSVVAFLRGAAPALHDLTVFPILNTMSV